MISTCSMENFSRDKRGVNKFFSWDKSIKCPAGGGIRTLPFRRGVTVPFPPCPRMALDVRGLVVYVRPHFPGAQRMLFVLCLAV